MARSNMDDSTVENKPRISTIEKTQTLTTLEETTQNLMYAVKVFKSPLIRVLISNSASVLRKIACFPEG
jgi:hypothetical protein